MKRRRFVADPKLDVLLNAVPLQETLVATAEPEPAHEGVVTLHPRGFGFVAASGGADFYLAEARTQGVMTGDTLCFTASASAADESREGEVRQVLRVCRADTTVLCEVRESAAGLRLVPDEPCAFELTFTQGEQVLVPGEVWAVRVPAYEGAPVDTPVAVTLERSLGPRTRPGFSYDYARVRYGFGQELAGEVLAEAQAWSEQDPAGETVRQEPFVTIDGESTRDIDDALWAERRADGGWNVLVAIADVSWYVRPGSALDKWAMERGTSLYLPGEVVPMLPEVLSTGVCSLQPGVVRRAAIMSLELDAEGVVRSASLERGCIRSAAQLSYTQVAAFMAERSVSFAPEVEESVTALADIYRTLSAARTRGGKLEFEDAEPSLVTGPDGAMALEWSVRNDAHKLVEELMLLANREAARLLAERYGTGLFRHQPPPDAADWSELRAWAARKTSHELPEKPSLLAMAGWVQAQEQGDARAGAAIRVRCAMQSAKYVVPAAGNGGHFSLNFEWYTHFSSPIRRYADLLVHRLLLAPAGAVLDQAELKAQVAQCSARSAAARKAERWVWDGIKQSLFTREVAPEQPVLARVVRVTGRGARVVVHEWQCAGWLPAANLRRHGYHWTGEAWAANDQCVEEGRLITLGWTHLDVARPAYPELQVALRREAA